MKRKLTSTSFAIGLLALLGLGLLSYGGFGRGVDLVPQAQAQHAFPRAFECNNGTVKGRYGAFTNGAFLAGNAFGLPAGTPYSATYIYNFDGAGRGFIEDSTMAETAGLIVPVPGVNQLTYKVKSDCTFEDEVDEGAGVKSPAFGVIVNDGAEIMGGYVFRTNPTIPGTQRGTFVAKRIDAQP